MVESPGPNAPEQFDFKDSPELPGPAEMANPSLVRASTLTIWKTIQRPLFHKTLGTHP
jgi:hypothetical protein